MQKKARLLFLLFIIPILLCTRLEAGIKRIVKQTTQTVENGFANKDLKPYLLPKTHPLHASLNGLFKNSKMFDSEENFKKAGFKVKLGHRRLMVGSHPKIPGYLIKKFQNSMPFVSQIENFTNRIDGANKLREFIEARDFKYIEVPHKWLYELPASFAKSPAKKDYILIVEDMNIFQDATDPQGEILTRYYNMSIEMLTELCIILHELDGCDAMPRNQPFTKSGKIAFVDTEHMGATRLKGHFIKHVVPKLNDKNQKYAIALWNRLEQEKRAKNQQ